MVGHAPAVTVAPRRRRLAQGAALALGAGMAAPALLASAPALLASAPAPAKLRAVTLTNPFFGMVEDGNPAGVFVDLISALAGESGIAISNALMPKVRAQAMLADGTADLLIGFDSAELLASARHVGQAGSFDVGIVGRAGMRLDSLDDLHGKTVGRLRGAIYSTVFAADTAIRKHEVNTLPQILQMLALGRIDAAIGVREALYYGMKMEGLQRARFTPFLMVERLDVWLHYANKTYDAALAERLSRALRRLQTSGELARLSQRYLGTVIAP
jgi:polar amino acid transport system substrate-binding protein